MKLFTGSGEAGCATAGNSGSGALGGGRITGKVVDEVPKVRWREVEALSNIAVAEAWPEWR